MKNKIIILYLRAPISLSDKGKTRANENIKPNGIVPLIKNYLKDNNGLWICCDVVANNDSKGHNTEELIQYENISLKLLAVTKSEIHQLYHKTSKEGFWPILHSFPDKFKSDAIDWQNFILINERFADAAVNSSCPESIFWIHDYNLWMVPYFIRKRLPTAKISFFHHTPFPSSDIFNILPHRDEIIRSLLCCDLCCFSIPRYLENFVSVCHSQFDLEVMTSKNEENRFFIRGALYEKSKSSAIIYGGRITYLETSAPGADLRQIKDCVYKTPFNRLTLEIKEIKKNRELVFAASRVDYIKGIFEMLTAFEEFLEKNPEKLFEIVLCLVCVPPSQYISSYQKVEEKISKKVDEINNKFAHKSESPIAFFPNQFNFEEMVCWYRETDILWVPSLRDGTNLICKEYIISNEGRPGQVILSEFAGAATELSGAILTNPYSKKSLIASLEYALSTKNNERVSSMNKMYKAAISSDIISWPNHLNFFKKEYDSHPVGNEN